MTTNVRSSLPEQCDSAERRRLDWVYRQLRVEMISAYWWRVGAAWSIPWRKLDDDFFFIPLTQRLEAKVERKHVTILPGQCLFVRRGRRHFCHQPRDSHGFEVVAIHAHLSPQWGGRLDQVVSEPLHDLPDRGASEARMRLLVHLMSAAPTLGRTMGEALLRDWLALWTVRDIPGRRRPVNGSQADARVAAALETIHTNFDSPLNVQDLAQSVRLGEVQFRKLFRAAMGQGPKSYLAEHRLQQAAQQLRMDAASVKEIARASGFSGTHYFHLAFRRRFGCTPLEYRHRSQLVI